jgi:predicted tellurium resistance membrane protein TerC
MAWLTDPEIWIGLLTLTALEVVLGIDNIVFISILAGKLPESQQVRARQVGLGMAMLTRILLLASLIGGGIFLLAKATREIHDKLEGLEGHAEAKIVPSFASIIFQIMLLDIVFSLDSVITAVGMVQELGVMIAAVVIAVIIMLLAAGPISEFVNKHPTIKILALSFLLLIGFTLVVEGLHQHIPKGYIYFAMGFSVFVEMLNLRLRTPPSAKPVELHEAYTE